MVQLDYWGMSELGLNGSGPGPAPGSGSGPTSQFQSHGLYGSGLSMGSLQNLARSGQRNGPGPGPIGGGTGGLPGLGGLQGRLTPSMGGLGHNISLLQSSSNNSRNPLFSRKMGEGGHGSIGSGPNTFDPSEFPSLGGGSGGGGLPGRPNYGKSPALCSLCLMKCGEV